MFRVTRSPVGTELEDENLGRYPTRFSALAVAGAYLTDMVSRETPGIIRVFDLSAVNPTAPIAELRSMP